MQRLKKEVGNEESWDQVVTQFKREGKEKAEVIRVVDEETAKRGIKILNTSIAIQALGTSKEGKNIDVIHLTKELEGATLERIIIQPKQEKEGSAEGWEFSWDLITLRFKQRKGEALIGTPVEQLKR